MDDFEIWLGGDMPVSADTYVCVEHRNGTIVTVQPAGSFGWQHAQDADLSDPRSPAWWDIVAWRRFTSAIRADGNADEFS